MRPSSVRAFSASRMSDRPTFRESASARSGGSRWPGSYSPLTRCRSSTWATSFDTGSLARRKRGEHRLSGTQLCPRSLG